MTDDIAFASTSDLAKRIRSGTLSSRELVDVYLERIESHGASINAVVTLDADGARKAADQCDEQTRNGESSGPLHGVPMTIKDAYEVAGMRTTAGAPSLAEHVPARDSNAVARLRAAGAVILGKTNVPMLSGDWQSFNDVFGQTNNPYGLDRTPGGSSGGAGAALAAGLTGGDIGSDIGGSIRIPAHFCGLFGLKTSFGLISKRGHIPPMPGYEGESPLAVAGPLGRSADDLELLFDILAGVRDGVTADGQAIAAPRSADGNQLRVGVWPDDPFSPVDTAVSNAVQTAATALADEGCVVETQAGFPVDFAESAAVYEMLLGAVMGAGYPEHVRERLIDRAKDLDPEDVSHEALQARGVSLTHGGLQDLDARVEGLKGTWSDYFSRYDALICPVTQSVAVAHDHQTNFHKRRIKIQGQERPYMDLLHWVGPATLAHLPAATAPISHDENGLPIGVQIIGPDLEDRTPIAVARTLERAIGGFKPPRRLSA